eukprot:3129627-Rhodomonas_salina.1
MRNVDAQTLAFRYSDPVLLEVQRSLLRNSVPGTAGELYLLAPFSESGWHPCYYSVVKNIVVGLASNTAYQGSKIQTLFLPIMILIPLVGQVPSLVPLHTSERAPVAPLRDASPPSPQLFSPTQTGLTTAACLSPPPPPPTESIVTPAVLSAPSLHMHPCPPPAPPSRPQARRSPESWHPSRPSFGRAVRGVSTGPLPSSPHTPFSPHLIQSVPLTRPNSLSSPPPDSGRLTQPTLSRSRDAMLSHELEPGSNWPMLCPFTPRVNADTKTGDVLTRSRGQLQRIALAWSCNTVSPWAGR